MSITTLEALLIEELKSIYDAEKQLVRALPKLSKGSMTEELKTAFKQHLLETKNQVERLEKAFKFLKREPEVKPCKAMRALVREGAEILTNKETSLLKDSALIGAALKVENYEIAAYNIVIAQSKQLGFDIIVNLFNESLTEEGNAYKLLTKISDGSFFKMGINSQIAVAAPGEETIKKE